MNHEVPCCGLAMHACYCLWCIVAYSPLSRVDFWYFILMKRPVTTRLAAFGSREHPSLLSRALWDLSGATGLKDDHVGQYLATWDLSWPLAWRQLNNAIQHITAATPPATTGEVCKGAVEAYAASILYPTAMCELVLNLHGPKSSWGTLTDLYTLCWLEYRCTIPGGSYTRPLCTQRDFQVRWKELMGHVEWDDAVATV